MSEKVGLEELEGKISKLVSEKESLQQRMGGLRDKYHRVEMELVHVRRGKESLEKKIVELEGKEGHCWEEKILIQIVDLRHQEENSWEKRFYVLLNGFNQLKEAFTQHSFIDKRFLHRPELEQHQGILEENANLRAKMKQVLEKSAQEKCIWKNTDTEETSKKIRKLLELLPQKFTFHSPYKFVALALNDRKMEKYFPERLQRLPFFKHPLHPVC